MIDKRASYSDKNFAKHLKGLGLSEEEIKYILNETKRKKFEGGGDGGGGDGGSSGGDGSSGDGSSGDSGDGTGDGEGSSSGSGGVGGSDAAGDAGESTGDSAGVGGSGDSTSGTGVGSGPGGEEGTGGVSAANAADAESGVMSTIGSLARTAMQTAINNPIATAIGMVSPVAGMAARAISAAVDAANRGVTAPNDHSQATTSVQSNTQSPSTGGGIATIQQYAPTYNPDTGNPTMDAYMRQLRVNLGLPV